MIKYMDKILGILMFVSALYTLYVVVTPNHLFIG